VGCIVPITSMTASAARDSRPLRERLAVRRMTPARVLDKWRRACLGAPVAGVTRRSPTVPQLRRDGRIVTWRPAFLAQPCDVPRTQRQSGAVLKRGPYDFLGPAKDGAARDAEDYPTGSRKASRRPP
jgi:hypothetical protein